MNLIKKLAGKFDGWEFWPSYMFYVPNLPYAIYLALRARDITFFTAANPALKDSGNGTESKFDTLMLLDGKYKPVSLLVPAEPSGRTLDKVLRQLDSLSLGFPLIAKPDMGFRGILVKKIRNESELAEYLERFPVKTIIQEFVDYPNECGIFYSKLPGRDKGNISSLTIKSFLSVTGDGQSTLEKLVRQNKRARHYLKKWIENHAERWHQVPEKGEKILLSEVGNHIQGARFINGNHLIDDKLTAVFDELSAGLEGWYYGRFDVKYKDMESLKEGKDFTVLEINGIISEPTHIYDPQHITYVKGLREFRKHWKRLYDIALSNMKNGVPTTPVIPFVRDLMKLKRHINNIKRLSVKGS